MYMYVLWRCTLCDVYVLTLLCFVSAYIVCSYTLSNIYTSCNVYVVCVHLRYVATPFQDLAHLLLGPAQRGRARVHPHTGLPHQAGQPSQVQTPALNRNFYTFKEPRIDSKESISPAYVAWRAGTITLSLFGS